MLAIAQGHVDLSDWLFLIAAIVFFVAAIVPLFKRVADGTRAPLAVSVEQIIAVGLCLVSIAWLVL